MNKPCARITLDLQQASTPTFVAVKKSDIGREIRITLSDGGFPYDIAADCYAVLTGTKPDGNILYNHCDIVGNTIVYEITEQTTAAAGRMKAEVKLYGADDQLVTSATFRIIIDGTVYDEGKVESKDEVSALTHLVSEAAGVINDGNQMIEQGQQTIQSAETATQQATSAAGNANGAAATAIAAAQNVVNAANQATAAATAANSAASNAETATSGANASAKTANDAAASASAAASEAVSAAKRAEEAADSINSSGWNAELKDDLGKKIDKPSVADNNKLPRAKDGEVEWLEEGQPTDEQTDNAVTKWLNEHPEATTTVQDNSLNESKFTLVARRRIAREYRTLAEALSDNIWDINTFIRTHGFDTFDDGGAGVYMVSSYTPGDGNPMYFDYAENKYLVYAPEDNNINICALGAKRDGSADCSELLNNLFSTIRKVVTKRFYTVIIPNGIFRCDSEISIGVNINIKGINSTRGNYINEYDSEIFPKENCSILYFPFTDSKTAITVNISQNGMFNIRDIALVSNTTEWKNEGFNTRPTIPYNPFSLTKKVSSVNGLNIEKCHYASIENCSFVGFSGYGLRTYSHDVLNCFFKKCGSGIINNKSDLMMQHCYVTQCDNGIKL